MKPAPNLLAALEKIRSGRDAVEIDKVELRLPDHACRVTVGDQLHFPRCIVTDSQGRDEIDRGIDDMIVVDPYERHAPSRRSDKELAAVLALLDELKAGKEDNR